MYSRGINRFAAARLILGAAVIMAALVFFLSAEPGRSFAHTVDAQYVISNDSTGGDCAAIGSWDQATTTCTLDTDLQITAEVGIFIDSDSITLDGNGHTLDGVDQTRTGILLHQVGSVRLEGLTLQNLEIAVLASGAGNMNATHDAFIDNLTGIAIGPHYDMVCDPICHMANYTSAWWNDAFGNAFINNPIPISDGGVNSAFNDLWPAGGNHYSQFDEPAEGCDDPGGDGICDTPYVLPGQVTDFLPLTDSPLAPRQPTQLPGGIGDQMIFVAGYYANDVKAVDLGQLQVVDTFPVPGSSDCNNWPKAVFGVAPSRDRGSIYVVGGFGCNGDDNMMQEINTATGQVERQVQLEPLGTGYRSLEYERNNEGSDTLVATSLAVGDSMAGMMELLNGSPAGSWPRGVGGLSEVSLSAGQTTAFTPLDYYGDGNAPTSSITWNASGSRAYAGFLWDKGMVKLDWVSRWLMGQYTHSLENGISDMTSAKSRNLVFASLTDSAESAQYDLAVYDMASDSYMGDIKLDQMVGATNASDGAILVAVEMAPGNDDILYALVRASDPLTPNTWQYLLLILDFTDSMSPSIIGGVTGLDEGAGIYAIADKQEYYGSPPGLSLSRSSVYWASIADYQARTLSVDYSVGNAGPDARGVTLIGTTNGGGVTSINTPLPPADIISGDSGAFTVRYMVPDGVGVFSSTVYAQAQNGSSLYDYPAPYPGP